MNKEMDKVVNDMYDSIESIGFPKKATEITEVEQMNGFDDYNKAREFVDKWIIAVKSEAIDPRYSAIFFEGYLSSFLAGILMNDDAMYVIIDKMNNVINTK